MHKLHSLFCALQFKYCILMAIVKLAIIFRACKHILDSVAVAHSAINSDAGIQAFWLHLRNKESHKSGELH